MPIINKSCNFARRETGMEKKGINGQRTTGNGQASAIFPILLIAAFAAGIIIFYTLIDPTRHIWTLKCPLHLLTGLDCPVCGLQRAIHALLHGDIELSLKYNAFFVISLPYLIALTVAEVMKHLRCGNTFRKWVCHPLAIKAYIALCFVWGILRNLFN